MDLTPSPFMLLFRSLSMRYFVLHGDDEADAGIVGSVLWGSYYAIRFRESR